MNRAALLIVVLVVVMATLLAIGALFSAVLGPLKGSCEWERTHLAETSEFCSEDGYR